jgi:hypothetical protein
MWAGMDPAFAVHPKLELTEGRGSRSPAYLPGSRSPGPFVLASAVRKETKIKTCKNNKKKNLKNNKKKNLKNNKKKNLKNNKKKNLTVKKQQEEELKKQQEEKKKISNFEFTQEHKDEVKKEFQKLKDIRLLDKTKQEDLIDIELNTKTANKFLQKTFSCCLFLRIVTWNGARSLSSFFFPSPAFPCLCKSSTTSLPLSPSL